MATRSGESEAFRRALAAEIRGERNAQGMTQADLAKRSRLGLSSIGRFEKEERDPTSTQLWQICDALGITLTELTIRAQRRVDSEARPGHRRRAAGG